jgi:hypothetical protein
LANLLESTLIVVLIVLLSGAFFLSFRLSFVDICLTASSQSGTGQPDILTTFAIGLMRGMSASVKSVTASPLRPARARSAYPVDIRYSRLRKVVIDNHFDCFEIDTTSHEVSTNQDPNITSSETFNDLFTLLWSSL